jgi:hypothetical protein
MLEIDEEDIARRLFDAWMDRKYGKEDAGTRGALWASERSFWLFCVHECKIALHDAIEVTVYDLVSSAMVMRNSTSKG